MATQGEREGEVRKEEGGGLRKERKRGERFKGRKGCKEMKNLNSSTQLSGAERLG